MSDNRLIRGEQERGSKIGEVVEKSREEIQRENRDLARSYAVTEPARGTILDEAKAAVLGSRASDYGRCYTLYSKMAEMVTATFREKLKFDTVFTAVDMPIFMLILKICREQYKSKRDNRVDIAGYAEVLDEIQQDIDRMYGGKTDVVPDKR